MIRSSIWEPESEMAMFENPAFTSWNTHACVIASRRLTLLVGMMCQTSTKTAWENVGILIGKVNTSPIASMCWHRLICSATTNEYSYTLITARKYIFTTHLKVIFSVFDSLHPRLCQQLFQWDILLYNPERRYSSEYFYLLTFMNDSTATHL